MTPLTRRAAASRLAVSSLLLAPAPRRRPRPCSPTTSSSPTRNVWQTGSGGTWSTATEDGSTV